MAAKRKYSKKSKRRSPAKRARRKHANRKRRIPKARHVVSNIWKIGNRFYWVDKRQRFHRMDTSPRRRRASRVKARGTGWVMYS